MRTCIIIIILVVAESLNGFAQQKIRGISNVKKIEYKRNVNSKGVRYKPDLKLSNISFTDNNRNGYLDAAENSFLSFTLTNAGEGEAVDVKALLHVRKNTKISTSLTYDDTTAIGTLYPSEHINVYIPIFAGEDLLSGSCLFNITILEKNGFNPSTEPIAIETLEFLPPKVMIADAIYNTKEGEPIEINYPVYVTTLVQNIGKGIAEDVSVEFQLEDGKCLALDRRIKPLGDMASGESKKVEFSFVTLQGYSGDKIPINILLSESHGLYAHSATLDVKFGQELLPNYQLKKFVDEPSTNITSLKPEVDKNIPITKKNNKNKIALVIGNENYKGVGDDVDVIFARNDALIFRNYALNTLGISEKNMFLLLDATYAEMQQKIDLISMLASRIGGESEIIFYYAGHGLPEEKNRTPYIIPVDANGKNLNTAIALKDVYKKLGNSGAGKVTVFLDACFSGGGRNSGLITSRGIKVKPKDELLPGNLVVFSASSNEQVALPYAEKQHGIFTYFLLKKLQETKGEVTYKELSDYLIKNVSIESLRINEKDQQPNVSVSKSVIEQWSSWILSD